MIAPDRGAVCSSLRSVALCALIAATGAAGTAHAADEAVPKGPPAQAPQKVWQFTGVWGVLESGRPRTLVPAKDFIAFTPQYEAKRQKLEARDKAGEIVEGRNARCIPAGVPDMLTFGFKAFANAEYMVATGGYGTFQPIWLNRREHTPASRLFPSYQGEAIAHWEGSTMVVDITGLDPTNEITYGLAADDPDLHVIERWTMRANDTLEIVITVESPKALAKPWTYTMVYGRRPSSEIIGELTYCTRPTVDYNLDLTPPEGGYVPPGADPDR